MVPADLGWNLGIVYPCEAEFLAVYKTTHFIKNFTNTMLLARISNLCSTTSNWGMPSKISIPTGFKGDYEAGLVQTNGDSVSGRIQQSSRSQDKGNKG